ncbi:MAG: hypothetical protein KF690_05560 [Bacteroidetes bacterium]|nr:hypothetical protein [Bacteroidota bacterium]
MNKVIVLGLLLGVSLLWSCQKDEAVTQQDPALVFYMVFDENQVRLDNLGNPSSIGAGNAAQTPEVAAMAVHYIELAPTAHTQLGEGAVLYNSPSTTAGGAQAIDMSKLTYAGQGSEYVRISLRNVPPGTYQYIRVSLAYQQGSIALHVPGTPAGDLDGIGVLRSYLGYRNYVGNITEGGEQIHVNGNRLQGFWAFYTDLSPHYTNLDTGSSAATTVVNPIADTSPIPQGSCVVTGMFDPPLVITGNETGDVSIETRFSVNNSFEWNDPNGNGLWEPTLGENPVDMGVRGLVPVVR